MRAVLVVMLTLTAAGQLDTHRDKLREWVTAVEQHRAAESDEALVAICAWTDDDLDRMRAFLESFVEAPKNSDGRRRRLSNLSAANLRTIRDHRTNARIGADPGGFTRHAAMLHTDAALICASPAVGEPPAANSPERPGWARRRSERRVDVLSIDAQYEKLEFNNLHWEIAMDMIDALPAAPPDPFIAQWYATIGAHFMWQRRYGDAVVHFDRARKLVPDDPNVLYEEARLHETLSAPRMQNFVRVTTLSKGTVIGGIESERAEMRRAESLLRRTLTANSAHLAARLRLGRLLMRQQQWEDGLTHVQPVATESTVATERYFANLFAGDAHLALGRADEATRAYQRALSIYPEAQAPRLGLAATIRVNGGEPADAIDALLPTLTRPPEGRADDDPWWEYYEGRRDDVDAMIEALRASFTGTPR